MNDDLMGYMTDAICQTFEDLAFMFGEPADEDLNDVIDQEFICANMQHTGDYEGKLTMYVTKSMSVGLTANILGIDEDDERIDELGVDALKEVLNVVCGQLITQIHGNKALFKLTVPETRNVTIDEWKKCIADENTIQYMIDEFPVLLNYQAA